MSDPEAPTWRSCSGLLAGSMAELLSRAGVTSVFLETAQRQPSLRGGDISREAQSLTRAARNEYVDRGFGFWDFLLSSAVESSAPTRTALWKRAIRHEEHSGELQEVDTATFIRQLNNAAFCNLDPRKIVSLTSKVRVSCGRGELHLPMLDFALRASSHNDSVAIEMLREMNLSGNLYRSGRSYHYFGVTPVSTMALTSILATAQLLGPLIDHRWISHQLINNYCGLRISTDSDRHTQAHVLVATTLDTVN